MLNIKLNGRLKTIADCIAKGAAVADIGTDHGYLPVYLAQNDLARRIIASDVSPGSLGTARRNAEKYAVTDKIEFVLAPGLHGIEPADIDTIVIAGVGGENIVGILTDTPQTAAACAAGDLRLILQPQTKLDVLRDFLQDKKYGIITQTTVTDRGREYTILVIN